MGWGRRARPGAKPAAGHPTAPAGCFPRLHRAGERSIQRCRREKHPAVAVGCGVEQRVHWAAQRRLQRVGHHVRVCEKAPREQMRSGPPVPRQGRRAAPRPQYTLPADSCGCNSRRRRGRRSAAGQGGPGAAVPAGQPAGAVLHLELAQLPHLALGRAVGAKHRRRRAPIRRSGGREGRGRGSGARQGMSRRYELGAVCAGTWKGRMRKQRAGGKGRVLRSSSSPTSRREA